MKEASLNSRIRKYFIEGIKDESRLKLDLLIILLFIPAGYLTYLFHELGHWTIGTLLGNEMVYTLNGVWPRNEYYLSNDHGIFVLLGGPVFTIFQAAFFSSIIERGKNHYAYPFLFFPVFSRFFSLFLGGFAKQDEAKISAILEIGRYTAASIVLMILFMILLRASLKLRIGLNYNCYFFAVSTVCIILIIKTYEFFW